MKEIALIGSNGPVMSAVLSDLLKRGVSVNVLSLAPERIMIDNTQLTISRFDVTSREATKEALEGYSTLVIANETNFENETLDNLILKYFADTVKDATEAGVTRLIVTGAKDSSEFYVSHLRNNSKIDWVFIDTEGDFAKRIADEVIEPHYHKENASF